VQLNEPTLIESDHFAASFDTRSGTFSLRRSDGTAFLTGGAACANTDVGKQCTASPGREHSVETSVFHDRLGSGRRLSVDCRDPHKLLDLRVEIALYDRRPMATIEVRCTNVSQRDVAVTSLEPIRVLASEGGALRVPEVSACLTNGEMFYDAGRVHAFTTEAVTSWWNLGLFSGYEREGVVLGYLENTHALGRVHAARTADNEISFVGESMYAPSITLSPGRSMSSDRFVLNVAASPYAALEQYADAVGAAQNSRTRSIVNGWCSWFYTLARVSEDEVLRNAAFAAQHLRPFGLEYIQIDDGYQRSHGDWQGNERFPHGMQWLAERIKAHGLKPGVWIAPYVISERSDVFRLHPEWLVKRRDGSLQRIGNWESENSPEALREAVKHYCLDITHPEAAQWLRDLFETIAQRWGYEMIKVDFMAWSILAAERYRDPTLSSAEVYRRGLEIMRGAVGAGCHLLECGPGNVTVGLIDSMRIEADINYGYAGAAWKQYFQDPACTTAAAAKRYYFHRRAWVNDADHVCLDLLTGQQAEAAATIVALSGGNMISGDRLIDLDPAKLEILKKITPSYGEAAIPVDLFDADIPTTFVWHFERPFAQWSVAAFFNPDLTTAVERRFAFRRLGLDPAKSYLAFDFWKQRFVGEFANELGVTVQPGSVTLLALHAATGTPQVLSTSRHVTQGAIEIEDVQWNETDRTLSGISLGPPQSAHDVFVHVPGEHPWTWEEPARMRDYAGYSLRLVDANIVRVHVRFENVGRVAWKIDVDDLFG
jgi:hypothetical protein